MALIDDIRQRAASKSTYNPNLVGNAVQRIPQPVGLPTPVPPRPGVAAVGQRPRTPLSDAFREAELKLGSPRPQEQVDDDESLWDKARGGLGEAFGRVIDVVDTPRAAVVSAVNQLDQMHDKGEGFSWDEFWADSSRNIGFGELVERNFKDAPWAAKVAGGFVGDVGLDPLTYLTAGAVKAGVLGNRAGRAALSELDNALIQGSRTGLATEVVAQAAMRDIVDEGVESLARHAGQRGRGAFTRQGLQRAGVDRELVERLGLQTDFGVRVGVGGQAKRFGVNVPGSRILAESAENLKGAVKKLTGSNTNKANRIFRMIGSSSEYGERAMRHEILSGGADAATAARGLAALREARRESSLWFSQRYDEWASKLTKLADMDDDQLKALTNLVERGGGEELADTVGAFFKAMDDELRTHGVEFGHVENYMPHMMTQKAMRALRSGDQRLIKDGWNKREAFQQGRVIEGTIDDINRRYRDMGFDFDVLETDPSILMTRYLDQAQRALTRQGAKNKLLKYGAASEIVPTVDSAAVSKELSEQTARLDDVARLEAEQLYNSNVARQGVLRESAEALSTQRTNLARQVVEVEDAIDEAYRGLEDLSSRLARREGELAGLEVAARHWEQVIKNSRGASKAAATKKYNAALKRIEDLRPSIDRLRNRLGTAVSPETLRAERDILKNQYDRVAEDVAALRQARAELNDPTLVTATERVPKENLDEINERIRQVRDDFLTESGEHQAAANAWVWAGIDYDTAQAKLQNLLNKVDEGAMAIIEAPGKKSWIKKATAEEIDAARQTRDLMREKTKIVMDVLGDVDDPVKGALAKIEAQAIAHDWEALKFRYTARDVQARINQLKDPGFIEYMEKVASDGFIKLNDDLQVPKFLDQALDTTKRLRDPGEISGLFKMYDQFVNWWKSWATASPGFIFRNGYSGVFGIWLDRGAGAFKSMQEFRGYMRQIEKGGPERAAQWATKNGYDLELLDNALLAAHGTGIGRTVNEVQAQLMGHRPKKLSLGSNSAAPAWVRQRSSNLETWMRGSHAYDVLKSGGSIRTAEDAVHKFHFNYRDISEFDQAAKRAIPFWMFFSRNLALQADVWTTMPQKLNRSYFNIKRNLELQADQDEVVPEYYGEIGAIQTPIGEPGGGAWYFTPDLPSLRFRDDVSNLLEAPTNPLALLADASPVAKVGAESLANRQAFTGVPFKNRLYDFDDDGNMIPREAPSFFQLPGVSQAADFLPGTERVNGRLLMQDNTQSAVEGLAPVLGRATRLLPNQPKYQERVGQSWLSFAGVPTRQNTEGSIQGELYRRQIEQQAALRQQAIRSMLSELG